MISTKKFLMNTGTIIRSKEIFVLSYSTRPKKNILIILMPKVFLTIKNSGKCDVMLVENNEIVGEDEIIGNIMNNYFTNVTTHLKLKSIKIDAKENLESIIDTFQSHESVQGIKLENFDSKSSLKFNSVSELDVQKEILNLSSKEATRKGDIPAKILKSTINSYLSKL